MKISLIDKKGQIAHQWFLIDEASFLSFCTLVGKPEKYPIINAIKEQVANDKLFYFSIVNNMENVLEENIVNIRSISLEILSIAQAMAESSNNVKEHEYFIFTLSKVLETALRTKSTISISSSYRIY